MAAVGSCRVLQEWEEEVTAQKGGFSAALSTAPQQFAFQCQERKFNRFELLVFASRRDKGDEDEGK